MTGYFISKEILSQFDDNFWIFFNNSNDIAIIFNLKDGTLLAANENAYNELGYSNDAYPELTITNLCNEISIRTIDQRINSEGSFHIPLTTFITNSGHGINIQASIIQLASIEYQYGLLTAAKLTSTENGASSSYALSKKIIRELKQQEATITSIFKAAPIGMGTLIDRKFTHVNDEFCKMTGYNRAELLGNKSKMVYPTPDEYKRVGKVLYADGDAVGSIKSTFKRKDGQIIDVHITTGIYGKKDDKNLVVFTVTDTTDFNRAQKSLIQSERRMSTLMGNLQGTVYRCAYDRGWTMEFLSDGVYKLTGYKKEDLLQQKKIRYIDLIHPDDRNRVIQSIENAVKQNKKYTLEYRIFDSKGTSRWVYEQGKAVFENEKTTYLEGYITDITQRKYAEQKINEHLNELAFLSQASTLMLGIRSLDELFRFISIKLNELVKKSIVLVFSHDPVTKQMELKNYTGVNKYINKIIHLLGQEPRGMQFPVSKEGIEILRKQKLMRGPDSLYKISEQMISKPVAVGIEKIIQLKEIHLMGILHNNVFLGEIIILLQKGGSIENTNLLETFINQAAIALLKIQMEESLRASEERLRLATKAAQQGLWDLNLTTNHINTNDTFFTMLGYDPGDLTIKYEEWQKMVHPDDRKRVMDYFNKYISGNTPEYRSEYRIKKKNGQWAWIISSGEIIKRDAIGTPLRIVGTHTDISHLKQIEKELLEKNYKIERQNEEYLAINEELKESMERVQEINEELQKAKEKAEESDKLKSAFLANMSHEIRTPMNGIIGFSNMLVEEGSSEEKRQSYAKIIIESSQQLLTIVNDILDISKIETGQVQLTNEVFSVNDIILELFSFYKPKATEKGILLLPSKGLKDDESIVSADKAKIKQVLNNLLSNALKFTHQGHIKYGYSLNGTMLKFFVKDTGIGIHEDMHDMIFDRFSQADTTLNRQYGGTGLGLAISKNLVNLMNGKIWLDSVHGEGASFYFTIPYNPVKLSETEEKPGNVNTFYGTILVAEDEEVNYLYIEEVLSEFNAKVVHAKNGLEAVNVCKENPNIDIVLMDIKMPVMNGYEATRQIKAFRQDLPVIAQTAYAMESDKEKALQTGCDGYLSKPIDKDELLQMINSLTVKNGK